MRNFLQENWFKTWALLLATLILGGYFYWFQLRPAEIKRGCSWVEEQTEAIPEVTQADIDQAKIDLADCKKTHPDPKDSLETWAEFNAAVQCKDLAKLTAETPHPATPSRTYYEETSPAEYSFCLHSHGL
ncbi:hypothetical protein EXS57_02335 [Candidatus Kaiserbacteria bacterium]|nr:hypothetical protein [Candidatus Kaiserbacteria bacterium]